jgi:hypothetical protein
LKQFNEIVKFVVSNILYWHLYIAVLLIIGGVLVNGPYSLITTAVSADLGQSLQGNAKALATVSAIIDGTGSVGTSHAGSLGVAG